MNQRISWLTALALAIPGAISAQSVHPFFKDDDVLFKPELLGKWNLASEVTLEFRDLGQKTYGIMVNMDKNSAIYFRAHLFCVDDKYFLDGQVAGLKIPNASGDPSQAGDLTNPERPGDGEFRLDKSDFLLNRAHGLLLVSFNADNANECFVSTWEESWLPSMDADDKLKLPHTKDELGRVMLTAETGDLRQWLSDLPKQAFDKPELLTRKKDEDQSARSENGRIQNATKEQVISARM
ncbi:MAG TPA: hypothetical protein VGF20_02500 [Candidatus Acidoferrum sp.]|jgi:hypothetical protein